MKRKVLRVDRESFPILYENKKLVVYLVEEMICIRNKTGKVTVRVSVDSDQLKLLGLEGSVVEPTSFHNLFRVKPG